MEIGFCFPRLLTNILLLSYLALCFQECRRLIRLDVECIPLSAFDSNVSMPKPFGFLASLSSLHQITNGKTDVSVNHSLILDMYLCSFGYSLILFFSVPSDLFFDFASKPECSQFCLDTDSLGCFLSLNFDLTIDLERQNSGLVL